MFMMVFRHVLEVVVLCCAIVVRLLYDSCAIVVRFLCDSCALVRFLCDCCTILVLLCNCCAILVLLCDCCTILVLLLYDSLYHSLYHSFLTGSSYLYYSFRAVSYCFLYLTSSYSSVFTAIDHISRALTWFLWGLSRSI